MEGPLYVLRNYITHMRMAEQIERTTGPIIETETQPTGWRKPEKGWYKLNTDGARNRPTGDAAAGGLIRDEHGFWMGGFQASLGSISVLNAELKAIQLGLQIAWGKGFGKIIVETDSAEVFQILQSEREETENSTLEQIRALMDKDWEVKIMRTERKMERLC